MQKPIVNSLLSLVPSMDVGGTEAEAWKSEQPSGRTWAGCLVHLAVQLVGGRLWTWSGGESESGNQCPPARVRLGSSTCSLPTMGPLKLITQPQPLGRSVSPHLRQCSFYIWRQCPSYFMQYSNIWNITRGNNTTPEDLNQILHITRSPGDCVHVTAWETPM